MATLSVRNLPDEIQTILRQRAARAGVSMEAEVRRILIQACTSQPPNGERLQTVLSNIQRWSRQLPGMAASHSAVDDFLAERRRESANEWSC